jgi:hypothetical protein
MFHSLQLNLSAPLCKEIEKLWQTLTKLNILQSEVGSHSTAGQVRSRRGNGQDKGTFGQNIHTARSGLGHDTDKSAMWYVPGCRILPL